MVSSLLIPKQDPGRLLDLPKVAQDVSGKRQIRSSIHCAPEPGSVVSPSPHPQHGLSQVYIPGAWRPAGLLQRAQTGSYSQAETCRILLCTIRQQHPCAGTDRERAQVAAAKDSMGTSFPTSRIWLYS